MKLAVVSVTRSGNAIADRLSEHFQLEIYSSYKNKEFKLKEVTKKLMDSMDGIIFIASTGIAVRAIAPFLKGKDKDPAIVVIDSEGNFAISLAGGHLGGANQLTHKISNILNCTPVITTATDNLGIVAPDILAKDNNLIIEDLKKAKDIAARLVDGEVVGFIDEDEKIVVPKGYKNPNENMTGVILVTNKLDFEYPHKNNSISQLRLIRQNIVLGMGCRKNVDSLKVKSFVVDTLRKYNIDSRAVCKIATVEIKKNEQALIDLSHHLGCPMEIHSVEKIKTVDHKYKGSDFVEKTIGARAVCEPCVELSGGELITDKLSFEGITLCIGKLTE